MAQGQLVGISGFRPPTASIGDDALDPGDPAGVTKLTHLVAKSTTFTFLAGDTPTTKQVTVHVCKIAGKIRNFCCGLKDTGSTASIAFDLKKYNAGNTSGVSVLSGTVTITNATTDRALQFGSLSSVVTAPNDWLDIVMTVSTSTGAVDPYAEVEIEEQAL